MEAVIYNILTYLILFTAFGVAVYKIFRKVKPGKNVSDCSGGCAGCSVKCEIKSLVVNK